jgi:hypothetical protein
MELIPVDIFGKDSIFSLNEENGLMIKIDKSFFEMHKKVWAPFMIKRLPRKLKKARKKHANG